MQKITLNQDNLFSEKIGMNGLEFQEFIAWEKKIQEVMVKIKAETKKEQIIWPILPDQDEQIKMIAKFAKTENKRWTNILVLGIGGSALGTIAIQKALQKDFSKKLIVLDNIDPDYFAYTLKEIDWRKTLVITVSKSGTTPETMAQFFIIENLLKHELTDTYKEHIIVVTGQENELRSIAEKEEYYIFDIPENLGGRFSVLSIVSLLPAALIGIDIQKLTLGASLMQEDCFKESLQQNPSAQLATVAYLLDKKKHKRIHIMCPYSQGLIYFSDWYAQLLSESIGKTENIGLTPIRAVGTTDQHSQLQLWNDGPNDKVITFLEIQRFQNNIPLPKNNFEKLKYLSGKSLNQLIASEKIGTTLALTKNRRANQTILIPSLTEETLGQLFFLFEMQIAILGKLYMVDPYNQPGVEEGKEITKRLMQN